MPSALLLTDIVDSTALSSRLGDLAMSELWNAHDRVARDLLAQWRGREIDKSDGFLLLFASASDALEFSRAYHRSLSRLAVPLSARAGLHVCPVTLRHNDAADVMRGAKPVEVDGVGKVVAARVMALAQSGQTLVTSEVLNALPERPQRIERCGHWRLKGIDEPVELHDIGEGEWARGVPPDSDKAYRVLLQDGVWVPARGVRHSLPAERDAFVGRRGAMRALSARFDAGARLVTLSGIGGIGKTRLALRYGWTHLGEYPGGVWFCDLAQARDLDSVLQAVAQGLGVPLGGGDPIAQLGNALAGRAACLVILDNFEQIVALGESTLGQWLARAPHTRFLATSREVLNLSGEEVFPVQPLAIDDASKLFVRRAKAGLQSFEPGPADDSAIARLVELLDGLPLAIELAAARVRMMSPHALLQRMHARFDLLTSRGTRGSRQTTLRATFDWSWDLLSEPERSAFAQLSVLEGPFTLAAAESIVGLSGENLPPVLDLVQSLLEKSLIRQRSTRRFDLLLSVREYAAERLNAQGTEIAEGARRRHCEFFAALSEADALADSCADLGNLIAACRHAVSFSDCGRAVGALEGAWVALRLRGPFRLGVELADSVRRMPALSRGASARVDRVRGWALRQSGHMTDAGACFDAALSAALDAGDRTTERRVLSHLGAWCVNVGRMDDARTHLDAALKQSREANDTSVECEVLCEFGNLLEHQGNLAQARSHYEQALALARRHGERRWEGGSLGNLGLLCTTQGHLSEAKVHYEAALAVARELGDRQWEGNTLCNLGLLHQMQGRLQDSRETLDAALEVAKETGYVRLGAFVMCNLGIVCEALGEADEALAQFESALAIARDLNDRRSQGQFLNYLGLLHARQLRFGDAGECLNLGERLLTEVADKLNLGILLCSKAEAQLLTGNSLLSEKTLARAVALQAEAGAQPDSELGQAIARVRSALDAAPRKADSVET